MVRAIHYRFYRSNTVREQPLSLPFDPTGIVLDRRLGLSRQLYQVLRARVLDGRLGSGTRLPASRDLAKALALSRNSVVRAYDQLYAEGFIESRGRHLCCSVAKTIHKYIHRVIPGFFHSLIHKIARKH